MPLLTVIAGPNGSGKSTLIEKLRDWGIDLGRYFNADDIAKELGGSDPEVSQRAQDIVRKGRAEALANGISHSFETVMSHISHVEHMREAKARGFEVRLYFVAIDNPEINVMRVSNRVAHGGHNVPQDRIVARYYRCLGNLPQAITTADKALIFDNSEADRPHRLLAKIMKPLLVHSEEAFSEHPELIPAWWLEILLQIKPVQPFTSGTLP